MSLRTCFHGKRGRLAKGLVPWRERQYIKDCIFLLPGTICRRGGAFCCYGSTAHRSEPARVAEKGFQRDDSLAGDSGKRRPIPAFPSRPRTTCQRRGRPSAAHGSTAQRSEPARVAEKGFQRDNSLAGDSRNGVLTPAFPSRPERPVNGRWGGPPPPTAVRRIAPNPPAGRGKGFQRDWSLWQGVRGTASPEDGGFSRGSIPLKRGFRGTQSH